MPTCHFAGNALSPLPARVLTVLRSLAMGRKYKGKSTGGAAGPKKPVGATNAARRASKNANAPVAARSSVRGLIQVRKWLTPPGKNQHRGHDAAAGKQRGKSKVKPAKTKVSAAAGYDGAPMHKVCWCSAARPHCTGLEKSVWPARLLHSEAPRTWAWVSGVCACAGVQWGAAG